MIYYITILSKRFAIFIFMTIGSYIGGFIPTLFGADFLSYSSLFGNGIGGILGIFVGYKLGSS